MTGIQCGGRLSSHKWLTPEKISYADETIIMWEPKVKHWVTRDFLGSALQLLRNYIVDAGIKGSGRVLTATDEVLNDDLKQAGVKAGIDFDLTSHVALKHTFVSFASNHGVPLEIVAQQTGTDPSTLMKFYAGTDRERTRHYLLGKPHKEPDFHEVMNRLNQHAMTRYQEIRTHRRGDAEAKASKAANIRAGIKKLGVRYNWAAGAGIMKSETAAPALIRGWKHLFELRAKGLSDAEIKATVDKERMESGKRAR
jgi:hypothetical protein